MTPPMTLDRLVRDAARRTPDAPAVHTDDDTVTYAELDQLADDYAAALHANSVTVGDRVLIWAEKNVDTVALMQGVLRVGAVYAPVAPSNPPSRVGRIAAGCTPALIVTDDAGRQAWETDYQVVTFAELRAKAAQVEQQEGVDKQRDETHVSDPDDPAYILYTSGSTGEPKGVCISHRNALAFVRWAAEETGLTGADRLANHAPFNFDLSVFDLYGAFLVGAAVDLIPADYAYAAEALVEFMEKRRITVWYSVPSALLLMMRLGGLLDRGAPPDLRVCVFAGEPFPTPNVLQLRAAWPGVRLFNWYGPTETNVCTSYEVTAADVDRVRPLPIGTAASGDTIILDEHGEIVVDGPTVMLGYWGREPQRGPYRTGDLGRYDEHGQLEYLGRRDAMVKVRGHRVELGEIEAAISTHDAVDAVAVVVVGEGIDMRLHAVVVPKAGQRPGVLAMKAHCAQRLPRYMIIDTVSLVDDLPRTANGKVDRAALVVS
ncbi:amino acid adenylation domain-containing protein [Actinocrispum wychmicini]|uniref:Clorobiocin biosynthesis protein CloN4 n=1 Tax=Actinocrispum wychmicini TaxID=1213861 RepID=A0A4R2JRQ8_9PSEU|nr:amino acid adenylation domain-containing protein [Actinocrispum wychmicini]TCO59908.1 clorobiocin biosynthesis protein CloN4 [Actinocrispum wychmicini]